ncbi:MAG TPA: zf-HC2 domain-containing protein [Paraburkholderia sp.]|jgi:anti-sigma factor RsiW
MNCDEARPLVGASVDRELSAGDDWRLREHLAGCADCRHTATVMRSMGQGVRNARYYRAPDALAMKIEAALGLVEVAGRAPGRPAREDDAAIAADPGDADNDAPPRARRRGAWHGWLQPLRGGAGGASGSATSTAARPRATAPAGPAAVASWLGAALLVFAALAVVVALNARGPASGQSAAFVDELVASHVRAQLSGRDLDVPSSDRHTVKPWFNGRIDYAPPVEDLAAEGFPLVGGRLDYVGRERVAVLVYHYRLHVIDVYVFPPDARAAAAAVAPPSADGFAVARWEQGGMTWWAVSDAGPDVLAAFRTALDARLRAG